jgi:hypothetical protein
MNAILRYGVLLLLGLPLTATAGTTVTKGTDPTKQVLRGPIVTSDGNVLAGELVIEGDTITCVAADCPEPPGASVFTSRTRSSSRASSTHTITSRTTSCRSGRHRRST